ncbi:MAG: chlorite dismutase family protein [Chloroflexi bacterium]|nr:chlorite dismutase family protein [Chloroflexota bacterium]MCH8974395.1 chlorite dismutase family protein [Chloroflexota bacterium]
MTTSPPPQFVKYTFYQVDPAWRRLPVETRAQDKRELAGVIDGASPPMMVRTYSLMGMRADADIMVWSVSPDLEHVGALATNVAATQLGSYLRSTHSYLAMTRRSTYVNEHEHAGSEGRLRIRPMGRRYLFVYPFVKTHAWYQLSPEERQRMMSAHFDVGHRYPEVVIHTSYSYGLDDQEFVLGFETDHPERFLELIMELRSAEQRPYTERDVPIFTCLLGSTDEVLDSLGG